MTYGLARRAAGADLAWLAGRLIAHDLRAVGVNVDCAPVLDVPTSGAHKIVGDRAFAAEPEDVARLGRRFAEGLMAGSVSPVIKHIPGHGRARADSHRRLPSVDAGLEDLESRDFAPFRALADMPMAMTAHIAYRAIDPGRAATVSAKVVGEIIRGAIGFDGLLMSDDLTMSALAGPMAARAEACLAAGCDIVLHCHADPEEMRAVAEVTPRLVGKAQVRAAAALAKIAARPESFDAETARARFFAALARS